MELHVVETEGIPDTCVLSVRAGATRRQAPVTSERPFRFPASAAEALPFKVDVLEPVASARLILRPGEERRVGCQYTVPLEAAGSGEENGEMSVTIGLSPLAEEEGDEEKQRKAEMANTKASTALEGEGPQPKPSSSASSRFGQATAAREYLDQHNLVEFTQLLVQSVIKEQPEHPYAFMAKQFYFPEPEPRGCKKTTADGAAASPAQGDGGKGEASRVTPEACASVPAADAAAAVGPAGAEPA